MLRENWISDELTPSYGALAELWHGRGVIVLARIVVRLFADLAGLDVPPLSVAGRSRVG